MVRGYIVCCYFRQNDTDRGADAIHSDTVYFTFAKALEDLKRMYEEQKGYLIQDLDEDEEVVEDDFDEQRGSFTISTGYGDHYVHGTIDKVDVDLY